MKGLYSRLLLAQAVFLLFLLGGLGIVLSQFFSLVTPEVESRIQRQYFLFLIVVLVIAFVLSFLIAARVMRRYAKPIDQATRNAFAITKGDFSTKASTSHSRDDHELSVALNRIGHNMKEMTILRDMEKERLKTLIESMGSGLLMFGRGGTVNLVNGVFRKKFGFTEMEIFGKSVNNLKLPKEIKNFIEEVMMTEQAHEKQIRLYSQNTMSAFNVYGAPVIDSHGSWLGIVVVVHDITQLIQLEELRKDFVANVSHELRTPITSIKGFTETLLDGAMRDPIVLKEFLEIVQKESNRIQFLIDDLLELSNVEREEFSLQIKFIHLTNMMMRAFEIVKRSVEQKNMNVQFDCADHIVIEGDESRLIQVMVNLLSNAVKYSQDDTTIQVTAKKHGSIVKIDVKDEGIGIEPSQLPRLFERFYRVDRARSRNSGGTGLGLAIVKHLLEAHSGSIEVSSELGVGTIFSITLPLKQGDSID